MLKKKWVKTGLAALLFSCLSVGAMAEQQWVRVADFHNYFNTVTGSVEEICAEAVANYNHPSWGNIAFSGEWEWRDGRGVVCIFVPNEHNVYGLMSSVYCSQGQIDKENLGCYALREVEPEPPTEDPCRTRSGEGCNQPPTEDPCVGKEVYVDRNGNIKRDYGAQACVDNEIVKACVFRDNFLETNEKARDIIAECVLAHENQHMRETANQECFDVGNGRANGRAAFVWSYHKMGECNGYIEEIMCLENKLAENACIGDLECLEQVRTRRSTVLGSITGNIEEGTIGHCGLAQDNSGTYWYGNGPFRYPPIP